MARDSQLEIARWGWLPRDGQMIQIDILGFGQVPTI